MTRPSLPAGHICDAQFLQALNDPRILDIEDHDDFRIGVRTCTRCGREKVTVRQQTADPRRSRRWHIETHLVPQVKPKRDRAPKCSDIPSVVSEARFEEALAARTSQEAMADYLGVSLRTLQRAYDRYRPGERSSMRAPFVSPQDAHTIAERIEGGMPAIWAWEDLPYHKATVLQHSAKVPGRRASIEEWQRVWFEIKSDPQLLALHREFAPKREAAIHGRRPAENRDHPGVRRMAAAA